MARTFKRRERLSAMSEINVTPLIDLAFALLIIFMITTPLLEQSITIELPLETARTQPPREGAFEYISLDARGQIFWGDKRVSLDELEEELRYVASRNEPPVISIRADANLPYQRVVDVIDLVKKYKLHQLSLDTRAR